MQQLIPITASTIGEATVQTVNARDLHKFLNVGKDFSSWIKNRIEQFDFTQGLDFIVHPNGGALESSTYGQGKIEYFVTLDMAKELSMVERNAKGKEARQYFIECERLAKSPKPISLVELLEHNVAMIESLNQKVVTLEKTIEDDKPMTNFGKAVASSDATVLIGDWIKALANQSIRMGRNKAFNWFRSNGYLMKNSTMPYQQYIDQGLFEVKETLITTSKGQRITFTTLLTGKGQVYFAQKLGI
jgi:anti-repressor protein